MPRTLVDQSGFRQSSHNFKTNHQRNAQIFETMKITIVALGTFIITLGFTRAQPTSTTSDAASLIDPKSTNALATGAAGKGGKMESAILVHDSDHNSGSTND